MSGDLAGDDSKPDDEAKSRASFQRDNAIPKLVKTGPDEVMSLISKTRKSPDVKKNSIMQVFTTVKDVKGIANTIKGVTVSVEDEE